MTGLGAPVSSSLEEVLYKSLEWMNQSIWLNTALAHKLVPCAWISNGALEVGVYDYKYRHTPLITLKKLNINTGKSEKQNYFKNLNKFLKPCFLLASKNCKVAFTTRSTNYLFLSCYPKRQSTTLTRDTWVAKWLILIRHHAHNLKYNFGNLGETVGCDNRIS